MASTGAGWLNVAAVAWARIVRHGSGARGHSYRWDDLDEAVRLGQDVGSHLVLGLRMGAGWFSRPLGYESHLDSRLA